MKAEDASRVFHGSEAFTMRVGGRKYVVIGYLEALEYRPPTGSRRSGAIYRHELGDYGNGKRSTGRPLLVADPRTGEVKLIKGRSGLKFSPVRGLVG